MQNNNDQIEWRDKGRGRWSSPDVSHTHTYKTLIGVRMKHSIITIEDFPSSESTRKLIKSNTMN